MDYSSYQDLKVRRLEPGILEIVMGEEGKLAVATARAHGEMARIWLDVDRDPEARVAILRGAGKGFSAGGDMAMVEDMTGSFEARARVWREARDLVYNMINCSKVIISAIHGPAVGAGLAAALLADISIAAKNARLIDGHTRLGVAAGDHAAIIWPLLCGMAKAKYYLLTCDTISGEEAEKLGLVSLSCDEAELQAKALEVARKPSASDWFPLPASRKRRSRRRSRWRARLPRGPRPRFAGPSTRSTTGCAWRGRRSTPRSRWK